MDDQPPSTSSGGRDLRRWAPVLAAGGVLAVGVHLWGLYRDSGPPSPPWFPSADKLEHLLGFALPVALILLAGHAYAQRRGSGLSARTMIIVGSVFAAHAVISEVIQHLAYTTRSGDWRDALADLVGVAVGLIVVRLVCGRPSRAAVEPVRA